MGVFRFYLIASWSLLQRGFGLFGFSLEKCGGIDSNAKFGVKYREKINSLSESKCHPERSEGSGGGAD